jgi:hypothetical protein
VHPALASCRAIVLRKYLGIQVAPDINGLFYWPGRIFSSHSGLKCLYSDLNQIFCSLDMGATIPDKPPDSVHLYSCAFYYFAFHHVSWPFREGRLAWSIYMRVENLPSGLKMWITTIDPRPGLAAPGNFCPCRTHSNNCLRILMAN